MRNDLSKLFPVLIFTHILFFNLFSQAHAAVEWSQIKQLTLKSQPLSVASSQDGQWMYVLTPGEVLIYSVPMDKIENQIPVDKTFDTITYSSSSNTLFLSSKVDKIIRGQIGDKLGQIGTNWDKLGQIGTNWDKLGTHPIFFNLFSLSENFI